jgi:hypothetical protein
MLGNYRVAAQLVASRVVLSSTELVIAAVMAKLRYYLRICQKGEEWGGCYFALVVFKVSAPADICITTIHHIISLPKCRQCNTNFCISYYTKIPSSLVICLLEVFTWYIIYHCYDNMKITSLIKEEKPGLLCNNTFASSLSGTSPKATS